MYLFAYGFLSFIFINGISSDPSGPVVHTPLGSVKGSYKYSQKNRQYDAFEGLPYAKQPVGQLRFKDPQPIDKWSGVYDATDASKICIKRVSVTDENDSSVRGQEDCLYLHVYRPSIDRKKLLPVLLILHGGTFFRGSAVSKVKYLMDRDVVVVSMNYRLGFFGFLSTGDHHIPGNMGLKDQSMALRWAYDNIRSFGGDPKKITLLGSSTGAVCVHFHYLSPLSKGYFQNGISLSGSSVIPARIQKNPIETFQKLADKLKCSKNTIPKTIECLRQVPAEKIEGIINQFIGWMGRPRVPLGPVVEIGSPAPFIDRMPIDIINSRDVADVLWVTGNVENEGFAPGSEFVEDDAFLRDLDRNWNAIAPDLLMYEMPAQYHDYFSNLIRTQYFGNEKISSKNVNSLIKLLGDRIHCYRMRTAAKAQARVNRSPVFFWYYTFRATTTGSDSLFKKIKNPGVTHADDLHMIFDNHFMKPTETPRDEDAQSKIMNLVISVAEKGYPEIAPGIQWEQVDSSTEELEVLNFASPTNIQSQKLNNYCNYQFWSQVDAVELDNGH